MNNWRLALLDNAGEEWFIQRDNIATIPMIPGRQPGGTPLSITTDFVVGPHTYQITVVVDPRSGIGSIHMSKFKVC